MAWPILWIPVSLHPQPPLSLSSDHCGRDGGHAWVQHQRLWIIKADPTKAPLLSPQYPPFSRAISQLPGGRLLVLEHFHLGRKGAVMFLNQINTYSGHGLVFSACNTSAKTTICRPTRCLIYLHGISHSIMSDQRLQMKCGRGNGFVESLHLSCYPLFW